MVSGAYVGHLYIIINTDILQVKPLLNMKDFFQSNDFTSLDGVIKFTMPAWWPIATAVAIYALYLAF